MEKIWPEKYRIYDVSIKLDAIARYEAGGISLNNLAAEIEGQSQHPIFVGQKNEIFMYAIKGKLC